MLTFPGVENLSNFPALADYTLKRLRFKHVVDNDFLLWYASQDNTNLVTLFRRKKCDV